MLAVVGLLSVRLSSAAEPRPLPRFERTVIDPEMPGGYQVEVADVNGDRKPDIIALGGGVCSWYENPTWKKRIVTNAKQTPGIISSATADLDGDGKAEIAIAFEFSMNQPTKGKLLLAHQGKQIDDPWRVEPIADVGSIHRLRWARHEGRQAGGPFQLGLASNPTTRSGDAAPVSFTLVVAPIFGPSAKPPNFREERAHLVTFGVHMQPAASKGVAGDGRTLVFPKESPGAFKPPVLPAAREGVEGSRGTIVIPRESLEAFKLPVLHAIDVVDLDGDGNAEILGASNLGVTRIRVTNRLGVLPLYSIEPLVPGAPGEAPKKGASEVHAGKLKDGRKFLATVEPWHGSDVAVYLSESLDPLKFGSRNVIDSSLKEGHALWVADVDGDGDDEVFAGYRGQGNSVLGYDFDGKTWTRTVIDPDIAAQDLRGGDLDGDGTPDVVAIGGRTHNVVWYRPRKD